MIGLRSCVRLGEIVEMDYLFVGFELRNHLLSIKQFGGLRLFRELIKRIRKITKQNKTKQKKREKVKGAGGFGPCPNPLISPAAAVPLPLPVGHRSSPLASLPCAAPTLLRLLHSATPSPLEAPPLPCPGGHRRCLSRAAPLPAGEPPSPLGLAAAAA